MSNLSSQIYFTLTKAQPLEKLLEVLAVMLRTALKQIDRCPGHIFWNAFKNQSCPTSLSTAVPSDLRRVDNGFWVLVMPFYQLHTRDSFTSGELHGSIAPNIAESQCSEDALRA